MVGCTCDAAQHWCEITCASEQTCIGLPFGVDGGPLRIVKVTPESITGRCELWQKVGTLPPKFGESLRISSTSRKRTLNLSPRSSMIWGPTHLGSSNWFSRSKKPSKSTSRTKTPRRFGRSRTPSTTSRRTPRSSRPEGPSSPFSPKRSRRARPVALRRESFHTPASLRGLVWLRRTSEDLKQHRHGTSRHHGNRAGYAERHRHGRVVAVDLRRTAGDRDHHPFRCVYLQV